MTAYWVNDVPAEPLVIELDLPDDADLSLFPAVEGVLTDPTGEPVSLTGATFELDADEGTVAVTWGVPTRFELAGIYSLQLTLVGFGDIKERVTPSPIVVEEVTGWQSLGSARQQWADAPFDDALLYELLDIAGGQVVAFAPALALDARIPTDYKRAQLMQSRNLWNATKDNGNQEMGADGFTIPIKPLDWHIRQLLRPKRGIPVVG